MRLEVGARAQASRERIAWFRQQHKGSKLGYYGTKTPKVRELIRKCAPLGRSKGKARAQGVLKLPAFVVVCCSDDYVEEVDVAIAVDVAVGLIPWVECLRVIGACYRHDVEDVDVSVPVHVAWERDEDPAVDESVIRGAGLPGNWPSVGAHGVVALGESCGAPGEGEGGCVSVC